MNWTAHNFGYALDVDGITVARLTWTNGWRTLRGDWDGDTYIGNWTSIRAAKAAVEAEYHRAAAIYS